jgi:hypothetical protein
MKRVYVKATKIVKGKDVEKELRKIIDVVGDIPGVVIKVEKVDSKEDKSK